MKRFKFKRKAICFANYLYNFTNVLILQVTVIYNAFNKITLSRDPCACCVEPSTVHIKIVLRVNYPVCTKGSRDWPWRICFLNFSIIVSFCLVTRVGRTWPTVVFNHCCTYLTVYRELEAAGQLSFNKTLYPVTYIEPPFKHPTQKSSKSPQINEKSSLLYPRTTLIFNFHNIQH